MKFNNENFESWILHILSEVEGDRYLFYDFEEPLLDAIVHKYTTSKSVSFLPNDYYFFYFKESKNYYSPEFGQICEVGYSDLVTARSEGKRFIVLVPRVSNGINDLPSDSSKGTSLIIDKSSVQFGKYISQNIFDNYKSTNQVSWQLHNILCKNFPNEVFNYFFKDNINNLSDALSFYGVLSEDLKLFNYLIDVKKCEYYVKFIDKIKDFLSSNSISDLKKLLDAADVNNVDDVIAAFWSEQFDLASDLGNNIELVFFRNTEKYRSLINVEEWIKAFESIEQKEADIGFSDGAILTYDGKSESDLYNIICNSSFNSIKAAKNGIYIPDLENANFETSGLKVFISPAQTVEWTLNEIVQSEKSEEVILNSSDCNLYNVRAIKDEKAKEIDLALYSSLDFNSEINDFAIRLTNSIGEIVLLKSSKFSNDDCENFLLDLNDRMSQEEIFSEKTDFFESSTIISSSKFKFAKRKNKLEKNSSISIDFRFLSDNSRLKFIGYKDEENSEFRYNYKSSTDLSISDGKSVNFKDRKYSLNDISNGELIFVIETSVGNRLIVVEIETEKDDLKDIMVSNSFLRLKALNDSDNRNRRIRISQREQLPNSVHHYYFEDLAVENMTYLPTLFVDLNDSSRCLTIENCPVVGKRDVQINRLEFRPLKLDYETFLSTNVLFLNYIDNRTHIVNQLKNSLVNNSYDQIDFSNLPIGLIDLVEKQLQLFQLLMTEAPDLVSLIDMFFISSISDNLVTDDPVAMFYSPVHPVYLHQLIRKSELMNNTRYGIGSKLNSVCQIIQLNVLNNWVIRSKKSHKEIIFSKVETDSLLFTGFVNRSSNQNRKILNEFLLKIKVKSSDSFGFLSYRQIQSALSKGFDYLSQKPEFNICIKGDIPDQYTNRAVLNWVEQTTEILMSYYENYNFTVNVYDQRPIETDPFPADNEVAYYRNDLGLNINWFSSNIDNYDITILTSQISNTSDLIQKDSALITNNYLYGSLVNYELFSFNSDSLFSDILPENSRRADLFSGVFNVMNSYFLGILTPNRQIQFNLQNAKFQNTQLLAISSQISSSKVLQQVNQGKSLWEFNIADFSYQDSNRGDYYLLAEENTDYLNRFKKLVEEINSEMSGSYFDQFLSYSKSINLFQLKYLLSNSNFLKEFIACVTARKLIDCVIDTKNSLIIPYDLFQPILHKIKREIDEHYQTEGTQYPDFILIEFGVDNSGNRTIDFRLVEIKYRSHIMSEKELNQILYDQTNRIKNVFANLNEFRHSYSENNMWSHTLTLLLSEMFSYYHDNFDTLNLNSASLFSDVINFNYEFRLNDSLIIAIDNSHSISSGEISNGIFFKIPAVLIHEVFDCSSDLNNSFKLFFSSVPRSHFAEKGEMALLRVEEKLGIYQRLDDSEVVGLGGQNDINTSSVERNEDSKKTLTIEESPEDEKKEEVNTDQTNDTPIITKPRIVLGTNVSNRKDVVFDPITMDPKKLANQHLLVVGKSGAGKSQTTSSVLYDLSKQEIPFMILDFQGEYISNGLTNSRDESFADATKAMILDPSYGMDINPLELSLDGNTGNRIGFMNNIYQVSSILKQIFGLGPIQESLLKDAIKQAYQEKRFSVEDRSTWNNKPPQFQDIWSILQLMKQNGEKLINLKYRIEPLFENNIFVSGEGSVSINDILSKNSIIDLSKLPTLELMKTVARFVLQAVYNRMLAHGPSKSIKLYIVIDEAHKLSFDQTLTDLIREARKYGVGFILASQSVRDFETVVFENMGTKIALQLEGEDAKFMADNFGATNKSTKDAVLSMLPFQKPLRALIRNNHYEPFVQVDIIPFYEK
jgi:hypothetical protein